MNKKQRVISIIIGIGFGVVGFICFVAAAMVQDWLGDSYANIIGVLGFAFLILSLIYLIRKAPEIITSEMEEKEASMNAENNFFTAIKFEEDIYSLKEKFLKAGFSEGSNYLHKKIFSVAKDYINYYVVIVDNTDMEQYIDDFLRKIDTLIKSQKHLNKNNYIYMIFFKDHVSYDELIPIKKMIISQDVVHGIPQYLLDTVVPIVYSIENQEYILRINNRKLSLNPIDIAMKKFCKIVFRV